MADIKLKNSHFLDMIDYDKLSNELKKMVEILRDEKSDEYKLILVVDTTRSLISYIKEQYKNEEISDQDKVEMLEHVIIIHQDLIRFIYDENNDLSQEFCHQSRSLLEELTVFYPAFIFNSELLSLEKGDDEYE